MTSPALSHTHQSSEHSHGKNNAQGGVDLPVHCTDAIVIERTAEVFKALATPSRLRILLALSSAPSSVNNLVDQTRLSQPLVSQHLKLLRSMDLVHVDRVGREATYSLRDDHVAHIIMDAMAHTHETYEH